MAEQPFVSIDARQDNPGSNAAKNISKIIEAMTDAQTSQLELKKQVMLAKVNQQMELQKNKETLAQGVQSNINQKQANVNWLESMGGQDASTPTASTVGGATGTGGVANSQTPVAVASPVPQPQAQPMTPAPMTMANPKLQPQNNAQSQMSMAPRPAVVAPTPPSAQYTNLGYKPVEAQQLVQQRRAQGQPINMSDRAYVGALQKIKAGTASQGEIDMVNKMNNRSGDASASAPVNNTPIPQSTQMSKVQQGLRSIEKAQGLPEGSMWMNPASGDPEVNPIWMKKVEALNTAQANYMVNLPNRDQQTAELFDKALDPSYYRAGAFGDSKKVFDRGEALQSLYNAGSAQPGGLDQRQIEELTIGYQNMLSRGGNSVTQVDALLPKSVVGNANKLAEWLTNNPRGTDQMNFVNRVHTGIEREMSTVQAQMDRTRLQRIATFDPWIERNPEQARNMMMSYGISPDEYAKYKANGFKQESAIQGGNDKTGSGAPTGTQTFTVGGVTYNIPNDKVDAFKQKAGIQ